MKQNNMHTNNPPAELIDFDVATKIRIPNVILYTFFPPTLRHMLILAHRDSVTTHVCSAICHSGMRCSLVIIALTTRSPPARPLALSLSRTHAHARTQTHTRSPVPLANDKLVMTAADSLSLRLPGRSSPQPCPVSPPLPT